MSDFLSVQSVVELVDWASPLQLHLLKASIELFAVTCLLLSLADAVADSCCHFIEMKRLSCFLSCQRPWRLVAPPCAVEHLIAILFCSRGFPFQHPVAGVSSIYIALCQRLQCWLLARLALPFAMNCSFNSSSWLSSEDRCCRCASGLPVLSLRIITELTSWVLDCQLDNRTSSLPVFPLRPFFCQSEWLVFQDLDALSLRIPLVFLLAPAHRQHLLFYQIMLKVRSITMIVVFCWYCCLIDYLIEVRRVWGLLKRSCVEGVERKGETYLGNLLRVSLGLKYDWIRLIPFQVLWWRPSANQSFVPRCYSLTPQFNRRRLNSFFIRVE